MLNYSVRGTAVSFALAGLAGAACAQSTVTVYGLMDAGVEVSKSGTGNVSRVFSGGNQGSRLGFLGSEDLGGGIKANFRLEMGINIDDGTLGQGGRAFGREASVGLSSAQYGAVSLGRLPAPYYVVQNAVDAFIWEGAGALNGLTRVSNGAQRQLLPQLVYARWDNAVGYVSPTMGGLTVRAMGALGEGSTSIGRGYSASARYTRNGFDLAAAWNRQQGANNSNGDLRAWTAGGSYDFGPVRTYLGYTVEKNDCTTCTGALLRAVGVTGNNASEFRLANVGVRVPFGGLLTGIAQVTRIMDKSHYAVPTGNRDVNWYSIGADYLLSKRTQLYTSLSTLANRNGSAYAMGAGSSQQPTTFQATSGRTNAFDVGIRHIF